NFAFHLFFTEGSLSKLRVPSVLHRRFAQQTSRSICRHTDNGRRGLENAVSLCLQEIIYKDAHFQLFDQIFKVKNI
ncbi:MAG: hypothetical protein MJZ99_11150, partial [Bacteroidales bacterium]|nr:hypothetical protein [Bacteroidales bacterium]